MNHRYFITGLPLNELRKSYSELAPRPGISQVKVSFSGLGSFEMPPLNFSSELIPENGTDSGI